MTDAATLDRLRQAYMRITGEAARFADDRIDVVLAVLAAGFIGAIDPAQRIGMAYQQAATAENRDLHLENRNRLEKGFAEIQDSIAGAGLDRHADEAHSRLAAQELAAVRERRGFDARRAWLEARALVARLDDDLRLTDRSTRAQVTYWAARLGAGVPGATAEAEALRDRVLRADPRFDTRVVDALLAEAAQDGHGALRILAAADDPDTRAALFATLSRVRGEDVALAWFDGEPDRDDPSFLTGVGWCNLAVHLARAERWDEGADRLGAAHAAHARTWPDLAFTEGIVNGALLLPPGLRHLALTMNLFHPRLAVLEGPEADRRCARADACFAEAAALLEQLGEARRAQAARDCGFG